MSRSVMLVLAAIPSVALTWALVAPLTSAQVRVGEVHRVAVGYFGEGGDGVHSLVFRLARDEGWAEAKTRLVEKATDGLGIPVVYYLERLQGSHGEKVGARVDAVLSALEEAGQYPLDTGDLNAEVGRLQATLAKLTAGQARPEVLTHLLMDLHRANGNAERALKVMETGEVETPHHPHEPHRVLRRIQHTGH